MGIIKSIYLPEELYEKLKFEKNLSGLIISLLNKHLNLKDNEIENKKEDLIQEKRKNLLESLEDLKAKEKYHIELLEKQKNQIESQIKGEEAKLKFEDEMQEKQNKENQEFKESIFKNYKYFSGQDMTEEQFQKFKLLWEDEKIGIVEFADKEIKTNNNIKKEV